MEITPVPHPTLTLSRGRVLGALLVIGPVVMLVFLPTVLGLQRSVVTDSAMEGDRDGSVSRGSIVLARDVPASDLAVGDVITFRPPLTEGGAEGTAAGSSVTRRIVAMEDRVARTRGDNLDAQDPWSLDMSDETYPRVVLAVPWVGYPFTGVAGRGGWVLFVVLIALTPVLVALASLRRLRQRRHREQRPRRHRSSGPSTYALVR